jgi:hypothetical protein
VNQSSRYAALLLAIVVVAAAGVVLANQTEQGPVRAERVSCDTGTGIDCDATLVNTDAETGYYLAVRVVGYDANGNVVTTYTNDGTIDGGGIMDVSAGGVDNVSISTSSPEPVDRSEVRIVDVEPMSR